MRFKPGQQVVCVDISPTCLKPHPKVGEIVTIHHYVPGWRYAVHLSEYLDHPNPSGFWEHRFEPLMDITELTEILEQQPAEI